MAEYTLFYTSVAEAVITVTADSLDEAADQAADNFPSICAQCSGWGRTGVSLDLSDVWELDEKSAAENYPNG